MSKAQIPNSLIDLPSLEKGHNFVPLLDEWQLEARATRL